MRKKGDCVVHPTVLHQEINGTLIPIAVDKPGHRTLFLFRIPWFNLPPCRGPWLRRESMTYGSVPPLNVRCNDLLVPIYVPNLEQLLTLESSQKMPAVNLLVEQVWIQVKRIRVLTTIRCGRCSWNWYYIQTRY